MYHVTRQRNRQFSLQHALNLAWSFFCQGWAITEKPIAVISEMLQECNIPDFIRSVVDLEKTYKLGDRNVKGSELMAKLDNALVRFNGKYPTVAAGRHRSCGLYVCAVFFDKLVSPTIIEINADVAERISFEENANAEHTLKLLASEKLGEVIALRKAEVYKKQADLPFKYGTAQKLWAQSELVIIHDIPEDKAAELDKEAARKAAQSSNVKAAVDEAITAKGGNAKKVVPGGQIREALAMALQADKEKKHAVTQLLDAICDNRPTDMKLVVKNALGIGAVPTPQESPSEVKAEEAPKQNKKHKAA